jgi:hypothetical protein
LIQRDNIVNQFLLKKWLKDYKDAKKDEPRAASESSSVYAHDGNDEEEEDDEFDEDDDYIQNGSELGDYNLGKRKDTPFTIASAPIPLATRKRGRDGITSLEGTGMVIFCS